MCPQGGAAGTFSGGRCARVVPQKSKNRNRSRTASRGRGTLRMMPWPLQGVPVVLLEYSRAGQGTQTPPNPARCRPGRWQSAGSGYNGIRLRTGSGRGQCRRLNPIFPGNILQLNALNADGDYCIKPTEDFQAGIPAFPAGAGAEIPLSCLETLLYCGGVRVPAWAAPEGSISQNDGSV